MLACRRGIFCSLPTAGMSRRCLGSGTIMCWWQSTILIVATSSVSLILRKRAKIKEIGASRRSVRHFDMTSACRKVLRR